MKNYIKIAFSILFFAAVFAISFALLPTTNGRAHAAKENPIYQQLNASIVKLYEQDIAHEAVVSKLTDKQLEDLAKNHGFSVKKTQSLLILADLSVRTGDAKNFDELATLSDRKIIKLGKSLIDAYAKTLSKEQKDDLKSKFLKAIK